MWFQKLDVRKNLLDYDRVNNEQREVMYKERRRVLDGDDMKESVLGISCKSCISGDQ